MMKLTIYHMIAILVIGIIAGMLLKGSRSEGFTSEDAIPMCGSCNRRTPCGCKNPKPRHVCAACPPCREADLSKYVLKSSIPPCPSCPDLSSYVLKTEVPPVPDLSNYVLKSSIPKPQPVILDCSKCNQPKGECPPCPRPRCPEVKCPAPTSCPPPAPCPRQSCPPSVVKCKAESPMDDGVRPFLAPLSFSGFGLS